MECPNCKIEMKYFIEYEPITKEGYKCSNCKSIKLVPVHVIDTATDSQWSAAISGIDEYYSRHPDRFTQ